MSDGTFIMVSTIIIFGGKLSTVLLLGTGFLFETREYKVYNYDYNYKLYDHNCKLYNHYCKLYNYDTEYYNENGKIYKHNNKLYNWS